MKKDIFNRIQRLERKKLPDVLANMRTRIGIIGKIRLVLYNSGYMERRRTFTITEIGRVMGFSYDSIRNYIQRGILPAPVYIADTAPSCKKPVYLLQEVDTIYSILSSYPYYRSGRNIFYDKELVRIVSESVRKVRLREAYESIERGKCSSSEGGYSSGE